MRLMLPVLVFVALSCTAMPPGVVKPIDVPDGGLPGQCAGLDCSGNGQCAVVGATMAVCLCNAGFRAEGTSCVAVTPGQECAGVSCSGHGACAVLQGPPAEPLCRCEAGYREVGGTTCLPIVDPCAGVTCSGAGSCAVRGGAEPVCLCAPGFVAAGALTCVAASDAGAVPFDGGGIWPAVDGGLSGCPAQLSVLATGLSTESYPIGIGATGALFVSETLTDSDGFRVPGVTQVGPGQPPRRLFDTLPSDSVRMNASHFYWTSNNVGSQGSRSLFRAPITGGTPTRLPGTNTMQAVLSVLPIDGAVYWTRTNGSTYTPTDLMRTDPVTLAVTVVRRVPDFARVFFIDNTFLYFSTRTEIIRMRLSDTTLSTVWTYADQRFPQATVVQGNDLYLLEAFNGAMSPIRVLKLDLTMNPPTSTVLLTETPGTAGRSLYNLAVGANSLLLAFTQGGKGQLATAPKAGGPLTVIPGATDVGLNRGILKTNGCQTFWQLRNRTVDVLWMADPP